MIERKISSKKVYSCSFLDIYEDKVRLENNFETKRVYAKHQGGAAILATTKDEHLILVKQYRYPLKKEIIEIPAGKMDVLHESFLDCAKRELEEETSYQSNHIHFLTEIYPCVGYSNEVIKLFRAHQSFLVDQPKESDIDEFTKTILVDKKEAKHLLSQNVIKDAKTIIAILYWLNE